MRDDSITQTDWTLVQRYLIGPVTPAETEAALAVIQREPRLQVLVDVLQTTAPSTDSPAVDVRSLKRRIDATRTVTLSSAVRPWRSKGHTLRGGVFKAQPLRLGVWYALAGAALSAVALVVGWNGGMLRPRDAAPAPMLTYLTGQGERASITLPDGSTVSLDVASRLNVPADYLAGNHTLRLEGEALFTVRHQRGTPLTVNTGTITARVLGTSFLVRHYAVNTTTLIAVREGRVAVQANQTRAVVLTAGRQVAIGRTTVQMSATDPAAFSFAAGVLTLTGDLFVNAIPELDRWYEADIRLGDSALVRRRLTGECAAGSLADLTELLQGTYNIRVVRNGRVLTLYRRK